MITDQLTTTSVLSLFDTTKEQRESFATDIVRRIVDGEADPLTVHLQLKCMESILKAINENTIYKAALLEAAERQGQKSFTFHNAKFETKEVGVKYDWSKCDDQVLNDFTAQQERLTALIKARQDMLKTVPLSGLMITDPDTGETYTVYPPAKSSTTSVAVTLK